MRTKMTILISIALLVWGLAIAQEQSAVITIRLGENQIAKIFTAPNIVSRISFQKEVEEIICGDLYDSSSGKGSFVIQSSGNDVFVKPVVAKGISNLFVKTGGEDETTFGLDIEIGPASKAQRIINIIDARPLASGDRITRPRKVLSRMPPVTQLVTSDSNFTNILPVWIDSIFGLSSSPMPDPPAISRVPDVGIRREATRRVAADYPEIARKVGAQGEVVVELTIDDTGKVSSAKALSGHLLLRNSAIQAARLWRFTPVPPGAGEGQSIARITFNFQGSYTNSGSYFYSIVGGVPINERRQ